MCRVANHSNYFISDSISGSNYTNRVQLTLITDVAIKQIFTSRKLMANEISCLSLTIDGQKAIRNRKD